ncbi:MAG: hypothetical protein HY318_13260 [Armatimonadetes bacterium]|nr:hypothetical protein [Armatimonadota bacterium]
MVTTEEKPTQPVARKETCGVTWRSLLLGILLIPPNAYWICEMEIVRYQAHPTTVSLFFNVVFILMVLMGINCLLRRLRESWALSRSELLVVYVMLVLASALAGHDTIQVLAPQLSYPYHFASPENNYKNLFFDYLPKWLSVKDPLALKGAYEGGTSLYLPQNYGPWLRPVLAWCSFIVVMLLWFLCANCLLRKRWTDAEKLSYPLVQIPLELTGNLGSFFQNSWFWIGFSVAAFVDLVNGFNTLYPFLPLIKVRVVHFDGFMNSLWTDQPWTALMGTRLSFYPFAIGLGLLLPLDLLFSCWFFFVFSRVQLVIASQFGWTRFPEFPFLRQQASGAYLGIALCALWMARGYLKEVGKCALGRPSQISDKDEPIPYRWALLGFLGGTVFLIAFACRMGMNVFIAITFFIIYFALSLAVTRIRAALGPPAHDLHHAGPDQMLAWSLGTGKASVSPLWNLESQTVAKLFFWFNRAYRGHAQPIQAEGIRIAEITRMSRRRLWWALMLAGTVGTLAAFWAQLYCYYKYGISSKISQSAVVAFGSEPYNELAYWFNAPRPPDHNMMASYGFGFLVTLLLNSLYLHLPNFPFHPVGYAVSTSWSMNCLWMPLMLAWFTKFCLLRYSGFRSIRAIAIPLAMGLVLGEFMTGSLWTLYGLITGKVTYGFWV